MMYPRSIRRSFAAIAIAGAFGLSLSACSVSASLTVSPDTVAEAAADALEQTVGVRPEMDCGADAIELTEDHTVVCLLTDPNTGTQFDTMVTLVDVSGQSFDVDVEVGTVPKN